MTWAVITSNVKIHVLLGRFTCGAKFSCQAFTRATAQLPFVHEMLTGHLVID